MGNPLKQLIFRRLEGGDSWRAIDIHCHILPGLDDGARDLSEAVSMLRRAAEEGISDVIARPHFHAGRFAASPEVILQKLTKLQEAADAERIPICLHPGSEIYYSDEILP